MYVFSKPLLALQISTMQKNIDGCFDYQTEKLIKQEYRIQKSCKIFRQWQSSRTFVMSSKRMDDRYLTSKGASLIYTLVIKPNGNLEKLVLIPPETPIQHISRIQGSQELKKVNTNSYIVVNGHRDNIKNKGLPLKPGSVLKLGLIEFKVVEIGGISKSKYKQVWQDRFLGGFKEAFQATQKKQGCCRFCLSEDNEPHNFLVSPCNCKGHCGLIHLECLRQWIDSKVKKQIKGGQVKNYNYHNLKCEICRAPLPKIIIKQKLCYEIITIERPKGPYIILESTNQTEQKKEERRMIVISLTQGRSVKIGRSFYCDVYIDLESVSKLHAQIRYSQGKFYINDQDSKFGTLLKVQGEIQLYGKIKLQIGNSTYEFISK